jgi:hypothetical protein
MYMVAREKATCVNFQSFHLRSLGFVTMVAFVLLLDFQSMLLAMV